MEITDLLETKALQSSSFSYFAYILYISVERSKRGLLVDPSPELSELVKKNGLLSNYEDLKKIIQRYFTFDFLKKKQSIF